ncbi:MAG: tetratricopeptide repeat protein [Mesorhizobium sp.]|nr:tetratricopeptide repeat protein [bacterium M00.F.Ca.ET.205.01.1.1]TGU52451.1 tetratricopeptide repeat protein [bacterium M00.F.Ca.ET.152.01.1.1]TGV34873.1 tetratricopeptide repeat protein [Mesorhizobium sp. M00.F.Ca.ET.186.01.1.1]TGZ42826.1 tetratricopeptide repeat protein [bacterium M00.F.Ca.ET.162.01.1.1]TJW33164.1 MAG: tetratricopeptide repeat protein [Mesorhizobium sp.]
MDRNEAQERIRALTSGMSRDLMDGGGEAFWKPRANEALALSIVAYGQVAPETAKTTRALAGIEAKLGNHKEAEALFQQAREIYDVLEGPLSEGSVSMNLGMAEERFLLGDIDRAIGICFDRQKEIERVIADDPMKIRQPGSKIDQVRSAYMSLLNWLLKFGMTDQAVIQAETIYGYDRKQDSRNDLTHSNSAWRLAGALRRAGRLDQAVSFYREAIAIGTAPGFPDIGGHSLHVADLAECLFELGRLEEAEAQTRVSIALIDSKGGPFANSVRAEKFECLSKILAAKGDQSGALSALLEAKQNHDQVEKWEGRFS